MRNDTYIHVCVYLPAALVEYPDTLQEYLWLMCKVGTQHMLTHVLIHVPVLVYIQSYAIYIICLIFLRH